MSKGLMQMVAEATAPALPPVEVSDEAVRALSTAIRQWSGWRDSRVKIGNPMPVSPWAACQHSTRTFTINVDALLLNPNRVLLSVTPFRLRQEAVLTGALLHEAGHARHSLWLPRTKADADANPVLHSDGTAPTKQTIGLARLMEEPRVEGLMFRDADRIGAVGLGWTMRASAAQLMPFTKMATDPNRAIMDVIESWTLRAGRQYALNAKANHPMRNWVQDFTTLLNSTIVAHLEAAQAKGALVNPITDAKSIINTLLDMVACEDDRGPTMIDMARDVLGWLFPETDPDDQPEAGGGCTAEQSDEQDESAEPGEGEAEPEDEDSESDEGASPSTDEDQPEEGEGEPEEGDSEGTGKPDEQESDDEGEQSDEAGDQPAPPNPLAEALAEMEQRASDETEDEAETEAEGAEADAASGAGAGGGSGHNGGWRIPSKDEREIQKSAEGFLRKMLSPSESSKVVLTESPSATVDGGELAAWKAGGQVRDPRFFRRTKRTITASPPVRIAVLVDVSLSMSELQKPSSILSWAISSAALDMRNFAGRGRQVESCLIHWGDDARVVAHNGETLPGIREWSCDEGTEAMAEALALVEEEMPGFYDITDKPVNRLIVQFTDWELFGSGRTITGAVGRALESGVNMLTIAPTSYRPGRSDLPDILRKCPTQRGKSTLMKYSPLFPEKVWETAAEALM